MRFWADTARGVTQIIAGLVIVLFVIAAVNRSWIALPLGLLAITAAGYLWRAHRERNKP